MAIGQLLAKLIHVNVLTPRARREQATRAPIQAV